MAILLKVLTLWFTILCSLNFSLSFLSSFYTNRLKIGALSSIKYQLNLVNKVLNSRYLVITFFILIK